MTRIRRLTKEGGWIVVGQITTVTGSLVLVRMLTEYLEPAQYGQLALGLTLVSLVNQVLMGGITAGIGRFYSIAVEKHDLRGYLYSARVLMGYATVIVLFFGLILIISLFWMNYLQWIGLAVAAIAFSLMGAYNSSLSGIQNAARQRAVVALHSSLDAWLKIVLALGALFYLGNSSAAVLIGYTCSTICIIFSQSIFLRRLIKHSGNSFHDVNCWAHKIWSYSWPMVAGGLFNWGYFASQRWSLEIFSKQAEVGQFYALTQVAYAPVSMAAASLMSFLTPVLFSKAGSALHHDRLIATHNVVIRLALLGFVFTLLVAAISFFAHNYIFEWFVAPEYRQVSIYMPYTILAAGILAVSQMLAIIVEVENKTSRFLPLAIIGNAGIAGLNFYLTYLWGIKGLVISMVMGAIIHCAWMLQIISKRYGR